MLIKSLFVRSWVALKRAVLALFCREDHGCLNTRVPALPCACTLGTVNGSCWKIPTSTRTRIRPAAARIHFTPELSVPSVPDRCGTRTTGDVLDEPNVGGSSWGGAEVDASPEVRVQAEWVALPLRG
jgi:hypothetical protein